MPLKLNKIAIIVIIMILLTAAALFSFKCIFKEEKQYKGTFIKNDITYILEVA